jgi:hypothetical protein
MTIRSRVPGLALSALLLGACAERQVSTEPESTRREISLVTDGPLAQAVGDPTGIPVGSPTRIDFLGSARASQQSITFPQGPAPVDVASHLEAARAWLAEEQKAHPAGRGEALATGAPLLPRQFPGSPSSDRRHRASPALTPSRAT